MAGGAPTPAAVTAVIRAYRPTFRSTTDKLAFAVHAILSVAGCRLLAVGAGADSGEPQPPASQVLEAHEEEQEEAPLDGWDATAAPEQGGFYAFRYALPAGAPPTSPPAGQQAHAAPRHAQLLFKAVVVGEQQLLASFLAEPCPEGQAPDVVELDVVRHCGQAGGPGGGQVTGHTYSHLQELVAKVQAAISHQAPYVWGAAASSSAGPQAAAGAATAPAPGRGQQEEREEERRGGVPAPPRDPLRDYSQPAGRGGGADPLRVGGSDVTPGFLPNPARFDPLGGALGGGLGPGGLDQGGGMLMGPGHPAFGGRGGGSLAVPGRGTGGPGLGMRWDPIAPPGLPGWRPGDFQRPPPGQGRGAPDLDPDIMQPGPGRGTDWDSMYG